MHTFFVHSNSSLVIMCSLSQFAKIPHSASSGLIIYASETLQISKALLSTTHSSFNHHS